MQKIQQYEFIIEGTHSSGRKFKQDFHVFATNREEALEELQVCMDYYEPVLDWRMKKLESVTDVSNFPGPVEEYGKHGAYTVYDPEFCFINS